MEKQILSHGSNVFVEHTLRQIYILSQEIVDKYLQFKSYERI